MPLFYYTLSNALKFDLRGFMLTLIVIRVNTIGERSDSVAKQHESSLVLLRDVC